MINPGRTTITDALNGDSLDIKRFPAGFGTMLSRMNKHVGWHGADDATNRPKYKQLTTLADCLAMLNDLLPKFIAHVLTDTPVHVTPGSDLSGSYTLPVTDLTTALAAAGQFSEDFNEHRQDIGVHGVTNITGAPYWNDNSSEQVGEDRINGFEQDAQGSTLTSLIAYCNTIQRCYINHTYIGPFGSPDETTFAVT